MEPDNIPVIDKNIIDVTVYEIKNQKEAFNGLPMCVQLHTYTALWCGPCKRIKPKLIEIMSKHGYKVIEQKTMQKADFKKSVNEFVPFFEVWKSGELSCPDGMKGCEVFHWGLKKVDSIQTSDETLFRQFLSKNGISSMINSMINSMILDNDF